jgi:hypothetical protein
MKRIFYGELGYLVGDRIAELLLEYGALLGEVDHTDIVSFRAYDAAGDLITASLSLGPATMISTESVELAQEDPPNGDTVQELQDRIDRIRGRHVGLPSDQLEGRSYIDDL